jgi:site-specific DNA recombinase
MRNSKLQQDNAAISLNRLATAPNDRRETTQQRRERQRGGAAQVSVAKQAPIRVALYVRVSADKSVENALSIPDQEEQLKKVCRKEGWSVTAVYIEPGVSAKTTARPQFQRMIADALEPQKPFDKILIHSTSRFARSSADYLMAERLLLEHQIEVLSVSQTFAKDAGGLVAKRISTLFDEYHSIRSAVDSIRARRRMIEEGHWPGGVPPYGYCVAPAAENPRRKVVAIDHDRSKIVEKIYTLALFGDGTGPRLGIKAIAVWLNKHGVRTRNSARWSNQAVHRILTNSAYHGDYYWGVNASEGEFMEKADALLLRIPPIISRQTFDEMQLLLEGRNPKMAAAKASSSPLLLSGIAVCKCGASMTLGTGTSKTGKVYRYYRCSSDNRGQNRCSGPRINEETLDTAVLDELKAGLLAEGRLTEILRKLQQRLRVARARSDEQMPALRQRKKLAESAIQGLMATVKVAPAIANQAVFQKELETATWELDTASRLLAEAVDAGSESDEITPERLANFRLRMEELIFGENRATAKIYLSTIISEVEVGERFIRIRGFSKDIKTAVLDATAENADVSGVRRYVRRWRREWDSNPR